MRKDSKQVWVTYRFLFFFTGLAENGCKFFTIQSFIELIQIIPFCHSLSWTVGDFLLPSPEKTSKVSCYCGAKENNEAHSRNHWTPVFRLFQAITTNINYWQFPFGHWSSMFNAWIFCPFLQQHGPELCHMSRKQPSDSHSEVHFV